MCRREVEVTRKWIDASKLPAHGTSLRMAYLERVEKPSYAGRKVSICH